MNEQTKIYVGQQLRAEQPGLDTFLTRQRSTYRELYDLSIRSRHGAQSASLRKKKKKKKNGIETVTMSGVNVKNAREKTGRHSRKKAQVGNAPRQKNVREQRVVSVITIAKTWRV